MRGLCDLAGPIGTAWTLVPQESARSSLLVASVQGAGQSGTVVAEWVPVRLDRGLEIKIQSLSGIPSSTEFLQGFAELVWAHFDAAWVSMGDVTLERPRSTTLTVLVYV